MQIIKEKALSMRANLGIIENQISESLLNDKLFSQLLIPQDYDLNIY